ncbi:MAG: alanine racemase [Desulfobacterales bacterium]|jgi:alanine racemase|nr:alanine racemase [Desulfobacterales bacterium]
MNASNANPLIWAEVDLGAVAHNVRELRRCADPRAKVMAVVKADGYGHGAVEVARTALANGAEWLGVARLPEAVPLREAGFDVPILVFGYTPPAEAGRLIDLDLRQSVYSAAAARAYSAVAAALGQRIRVHLKVDTGMGRLGMVPATLSGKTPGHAVGEDFIREATAIARLPGLETEGIFTHFAASDSADTSYAERQLSLFLEVLAALRAAGLEFALRHAANSAAVIALPASHLDLVRPGIALYGLKPSDEVDLAAVSLKPAMALKTRIIHLKPVPAGTCISYGMTYRTPSPTVIATVPAGYADGFRRLFSSRGEMLVGGRRVPVVGRVCMDLTMLDVGSVPGVRVEDEVVVFGRQGGASISADDLARALGTINYEIVCDLTARVPRVYLKN